MNSYEPALPNPASGWTFFRSQHTAPSPSQGTRQQTTGYAVLKSKAWKILTATHQAPIWSQIEYLENYQEFYKYLDSLHTKGERTAFSFFEGLCSSTGLSWVQILTPPYYSGTQTNSVISLARKDFPTSSYSVIILIVKPHPSSSLTCSYWLSS